MAATRAMLAWLVFLAARGAQGRRTVAPPAAAGSPGAAVPQAKGVMAMAMVGRGPAASRDMAVVSPETAHQGRAVCPPGRAARRQVQVLCLGALAAVCPQAPEVQAAYPQAPEVQAAYPQAPEVQLACLRVPAAQAACPQVPEVQAVCSEVQAACLQVPAAQAVHQVPAVRQRAPAACPLVRAVFPRVAAVRRPVQVGLSQAASRCRKLH